MMTRQTKKDMMANKNRSEGIQKMIVGIASLVGIVIIITSCTPQKRLHRLLALHTELTNKEVVHINDSIFIPKTILDTFFLEKYLVDTITLQEEKLTVKLLKIHDTVYLDAWHDPDTVVIEKEIPIEKIIHEIPKSPSFIEEWQGLKDWLPILVILLIIGILIGVLIRR